MTEHEFESWCRNHGACNVNIEDEIEVWFALDLLKDYFKENQCGVFPSLRTVFNQIDTIQNIAY